MITEWQILHTGETSKLLEWQVAREALEVRCSELKEWGSSYKKRGEEADEQLHKANGAIEKLTVGSCHGPVALIHKTRRLFCQARVWRGTVSYRMSHRLKQYTLSRWCTLVVILDSQFQVTYRVGKTTQFQRLLPLDPSHLEEKPLTRLVS